jgi:secondary thiamine-phosphate synthase enzyme
MNLQRRNVQFHTEHKQQLLNITEMLHDALAAMGIRDGMVAVYSQHTTAALFVSEFQPALIDDMQEFFKRIVTEDLPYRHNSPEFSDCERRNAAAHLRSVLLSHSVMLPIIDGKPALGQFQSLILAELDGPRDRTLTVQALGL